MDPLTHHIEHKFAFYYILVAAWIILMTFIMSFYKVFVSKNRNNEMQQLPQQLVCVVTAFFFMALISLAVGHQVYDDPLAVGVPYTIQNFFYDSGNVCLYYLFIQRLVITFDEMQHTRYGITKWQYNLLMIFITIYAFGALGFIFVSLSKEYTSELNNSAYLYAMSVIEFITFFSDTVNSVLLLYLFVNQAIYVTLTMYGTSRQAVQTFTAQQSLIFDKFVVRKSILSIFAIIATQFYLLLGLITVIIYVVVKPAHEFQYHWYIFNICCICNDTTINSICLWLSLDTKIGTNSAYDKVCCCCKECCNNICIKFAMRKKMEIRLMTREDQDDASNMNSVTQSMSLNSN
eukprot:114843_1